MRVKIGSIVEIPTAKGFAYAQYTHRHPVYGDLIRIIQGLYQSTPRDLGALVKTPHSYVVFFPLGTVVHRKIFKIIGHQPVPGFAQKFPIFKGEVRDPKTNKILAWYLWDGDKEWKLDRPLSEEEKKYPMSEIWNDTLLIQRIEEGWLPEHVE